MEFVSVEQMVRLFLRTIVEPPVEILVPADRPAQFVRVFRTGGVARDRITDLAQITVQAWATDRYDAERLASACRMALLSGSSEMKLVRRVEETGGLHFNPDPKTNTPRYQFTVTLTVRAKR
ncbi:hypothetical protein [Microbacterium oxydans]|uniref:hypothetical protein n=1 Tax=Microbacterium oxydans TaxID=82380 RepID=UPI000733DF0C|nr:hypothetical protein [Microbacterium oxydans]KTR77999.1 hypothetical protein NS234_04840 [Microbacterium oxydans]